VENYQCGFYADPRNPAEFITKLEPFVVNKRLLKQFQHNARRLAEEKFERKMLTADLIKFIES
jgi:hypothetical protein